MPTLFRIAKILVAGAGLFVVSLLVDLVPLMAARPPKDLKTIKEFRDWKREDITGRGTFENAGVVYTVFLAAPGRFLASGPSAYLFDDQGRFIDWTSDMGDVLTVRHRFNLMSGHMKRIEGEQPSGEPDR